MSASQHPPSRDDTHAVASLRAPLWILAVVATLLFLRETREVWVPIALALLASYALYPITNWLHRRARLNRVLSAAVVVALVMGGLGWLGWSLSDDFTSAARDLPQQMRELRQQLAAQTSGGTIDRLREAATEVQGAAQDASMGTSNGSSRTTQRAATAARSTESTTMQQYLWQGSSGLAELIGQFVVVVFLVFFLLVGADAWRARLVRLAGDVLSSRRTGQEVLDDITWQVQRFLVVRLATSAVVAVATWLALAWIGAPAAGFWGASAGVLNSVPYFGPIIVSGGLAVVGLVSGGFTMAIEMAGVALLITTLEGWLLTPPLLGRAAQMNTLAVFVGLLIWSWAWGIWGTILAVPLLSILKAVSDHVEPLEWLSRLLGQEVGYGHHNAGRK